MEVGGEAAEAEAGTSARRAHHTAAEGVMVTLLEALGKLAQARLATMRREWQASPQAARLAT